MAIFGYNVSGDGGSYAWDNQTVVGKYALSEAGSVTKLTVQINNMGSSHSACHIKAVIYADNSGSPDVWKATGDAIAIADNIAIQWVDLTFASPVALTAGTYWIGFIGSGSAGDTAVGVEFRMLTTGSASTEDYQVDTYTDGALSPWGATHHKTAGRGMCVYATYDLPGFTGLTVTKLLQG